MKKVMVFSDIEGIKTLYQFERYNENFFKLTVRIMDNYGTQVRSYKFTKDTKLFIATHDDVSYLDDEAVFYMSNYNDLDVEIVGLPEEQQLLVNEVFEILRITIADIKNEWIVIEEPVLF